MKKVYVNMTVRMLVYCEDDIDISEVVNELDLEITSSVDGSNVHDYEIVDWE